MKIYSWGPNLAQSVSEDFFRGISMGGGAGLAMGRWAHFPYVQRPWGGSTLVRLRLWQREQGRERLLCLLVILGSQIQPSNHLQGLQKNFYKSPVPGTTALWVV